MTTTATPNATAGRTCELSRRDSSGLLACCLQRHRLCRKPIQQLAGATDNNAASESYFAGEERPLGAQPISALP